MRLNIIKQIKTIVVIIMGIILTFVAGCEKGISNPENTKDYLEYGNIIREGLIAFYPFDGNAKDYSGNELNALENGPSASIGRFGQQGGALKFDGVNDYLKIPYFTSIDGDNGTLCFWIKTHSSINIDKKAAVISKSDSVGVGYVLSVYGLHDYWFEYKIQNIRVKEAMHTNFWEEGRYLFLAVTFSDNKLTYYFQGYPTEEITLEVGEFRFNNNRQPLFIGKSLISHYEYFEGNIDDLLIYNRELSKDEILKLYNWK